MNTYVYYRIDPTLAVIATERVDALLSSMSVHCGRSPYRLCRSDDPETWMEVYEGVADYAAFSAALSTAVASLDCETFTLGERHLECFLAPIKPPH